MTDQKSNDTTEDRLHNNFLRLREASQSDLLEGFKSGVASQILGRLLYKEVDAETEQKAALRGRPPRKKIITIADERTLTKLESLTDIDGLLAYAKTMGSQQDRAIIDQAMTYADRFTKFPSQKSSFINYLDYGQLCQEPSISNVLLGRMTIAAIELERADLLELVKSRCGVAVVASVPPITEEQARASNMPQGYRPINDHLNLMGHFFPSGPLENEFGPLTNDNIARIKEAGIYGSRYLQASTVAHDGTVNATLREIR